MEPTFYEPDEEPPFEEDRLFDEDAEESEEEDDADGARFGGLLRGRVPGPLAALGAGALGRAKQQRDRGSASDHLLSADEGARRASAAAAPPGGAADAAQGGSATTPSSYATPCAGTSSPGAPAGEAFGLEFRALRGASGEVRGSFEKRSPWWVEGWRPRGYVLRDGRLSWFAPHRPDRPLGVLDFGLVRYELHCGWRRECPDGGGEAEAETPEKPRGAPCDACDSMAPADWRVVYLVPSAFPSKVFAFRGPRGEMAALAAEIAGLTGRWHGPSTGLRAEREVVSLRNFWRYPFLRDSEFVERADTADILLFRGKDTAARLQRGATGALYDHVGLVLRTGPGEVMLLEAMGRTGVAVCPWRRFKERGWHLAYDWIAYRRVYFDRSRAQLESLQRFIDAVRGCPYGLTVDKLLNRTLSAAFDEEGSMQRPDPESRGRGDEEAQLQARSFFCSELVAACLKRCGVLAGSAASSCYWPGSFGQRCEDPLPLQGGAHVGCEEVLAFGA